MWRFLTVCVAMVSVAMATNGHWEKYKMRYDLSFNKVEESVRQVIFEKNVQIIKDHNIEADLGIHTYWLGVNHFAHMSHEEYIAEVLGNGLLDRNITKSRADHVHEYDPTLTDLPDTVDWRDKGYVTPVKDQGMCGSCWAFSAIGSLEGQHFKKTGELVSLSEQNLVDCSWAYGNFGCNGGWMDTSFQYMKDNGGVATEEAYPYKGLRSDGSCKYNAADLGATVTGYVDVKGGDEEALKQAVATVGPISVAMDAGRLTFRFYRRGVYSSWLCGSKLRRLNHAVVAVGYGTAEGFFRTKDYWLLKNSWGTFWGDHGYVKMARNHGNMCGTATLASYPTV